MTNKSVLDDVVRHDLKHTRYILKSHVNYFCEERLEWVADIKDATLYIIPPPLMAFYEVLEVEMDEFGRLKSYGAVNHIS